MDEIRQIVADARKMGCRRWSISGGEPLLREDFPEIFSILTEKSISYSLNTNGTLITPEIARLLKKPGSKMVALYGATAEVHDHITRNPGSFEAVLRAFSYLKEAGAGFTVQIVPMRDNFHQLQQMLDLARMYSPHSRIGASWLYLSASGLQAKNREIISQRLDPAAVVQLDPPMIDADMDEAPSCEAGCGSCLFEGCIQEGNNFHIDPYGQMSFCCFIKDPALRFNLRAGSFQQGWEEFLPSQKNAVVGDQRYRENCGSCAMRTDCNWCGAYAYLEHRDYSAPIEYLCRVTEEKQRYRQNYLKEHRAFFQIGGLTVQYDSDLPLTGMSFSDALKCFKVEQPGPDMVTIHHVFEMPDNLDKGFGVEVYRKEPWTIYKNGTSWVYVSPLGDVSEEENPDRSPLPIRIIVCSQDYTNLVAYHSSNWSFQSGTIDSLSMFPTDQIWLAQVLSRREGSIVHAAGMSMDGQGLLFVGHSEAGKSTTVTMLRDEAQILCDDRIILRRLPEGYRIYGTWSHGDVPDVSPADVPLRGMFFLEKSSENRVTRITDPKEIVKKLPFYIIKPYADAQWWENTLQLVEKIAREVPVYRLELDKSGRIKELMGQFVREQRAKGS